MEFDKISRADCSCDEEGIFWRWWGGSSASWITINPNHWIVVLAVALLLGYVFNRVPFYVLDDFCRSRQLDSLPWSDDRQSSTAERDSAEHISRSSDSSSFAWFSTRTHACCSDDDRTKELADETAVELALVILADRYFGFKHSCRMTGRKAWLTPKNTPFPNMC